MKKLLLCLLLFTIAYTHVKAQEGDGYLIWFKSRVHEELFLTKYRSVITNAHRINPTRTLWKLNFAEKTELNEILKDSSIEIKQVNHRLELRNKVPNDPEFQKQYNLLNTGQNGGKVGSDISVTKVWEHYTGGVTERGDTIVIALVDAGCDVNHEDLYENIYTNYKEIPNDSIDNDSNGYKDDYKGYNAIDNNGAIAPGVHGTFIAGVMGARGDNGKGVAGINWKVKILPVVAATSDEAGVVAAYLYIYDQRKLYNESNGKKGAFIVAANSSFGLFQVKISDFPIWCSMYESMGMVGVVSTAATVNSYVDIKNYGDVPSMCASNFLMVVTNTDKNDNLTGAGYSDTYIDLSAPATDIYSTFLNNTYDSWTGTSFAAPQVAAAVALLYNLPCKVFSNLYMTFPDSAARMMVQHILQSVDPIPDMKGKSTTGGRLNIYQAVLDMIKEGCFPLGLETHSAVKSEVYPNPADDYLYIERMNSEEFYLSDMLGRSVSVPFIYKDLEMVLDVSTLPSGVYILKTKDMELKVIIQH